MTFEQIVRIAEGYSELGMLDDALAQLALLDPELEDRFEILRMKIDILLRKAGLERSSSTKSAVLFLAFEPTLWPRSCSVLPSRARTDVRSKTDFAGRACITSG